MSEHRILLVGHGMISHRYVEAFSHMPNASIVGVVGRDQERASAYAREKGIAYADTDLERAAVMTGATAAVVCTPNAAHGQAVLAAAKLGLHILCEKPLHIDPAVQTEMIASCRENGVKLAVSFMRRFTDHIQYVRELIERGNLGRLQVVDAVLKHYRPQSYYGTWHGTYAMDGGGPFIQQASHMIDLVLWLTGPYREVLDAKLFQAAHEIETEDHGYACIAYKNGAIGMIEASTACAGMDQEYLAISGTKGSIVLDFAGIRHFRVEGIESPPDFPEVKTEHLFRRLAEDFIRSIEQDAEPFISGESAAQAVELVVEIYRKAGTVLRLEQGSSPTA